MKNLVIGVVSFLIGMVVAWVCYNLTSMDSPLVTVVSVIVALCACRVLKRLTDQSNKNQLK